MIRKLTSLTSLPSETKNHAQKLGQITDGKNDGNDASNRLSSGLLSQNHA